MIDNAILLLLVAPALLTGVPARYAKEPGVDNEVRLELNRLRSEVRMQEDEIRKLREHTATQDETIDELRDLVAEAKKPTSQIKNDSSDDIRSLRQHAETLTDAVNQNKSAIAKLEQNTAHLQKALESVMAALGLKQETATPNGWYTVKSGDSLGEIAFRNGTSTETLKKINQLKSDKIFVGQKIRLP